MKPLALSAIALAITACSQQEPYPVSQKKLESEQEKQAEDCWAQAENENEAHDSRRASIQKSVHDKRSEETANYEATSAARNLAW